MAATNPASPGVPAASSRVSLGDLTAALQDRLAPPPLNGIPPSVMLAVAPGPGKILEEWRHAALGTWIAWPHAADAIHAEEMTAGQLRAILAARGSR